MKKDWVYKKMILSLIIYKFYFKNNYYKIKLNKVFFLFYMWHLFINEFFILPKAAKRTAFLPPLEVLFK
jgi:hypothetical protein